MKTVLDVIQALSGIATTFGVFFAAFQIREARKQATTSFEDQMSEQYREIAKRLPIEALLGEPLDEIKQKGSLPHFYHYFDLSNEQAFLHEKGRVSREAWKEWREGIRQNLSRPGFSNAWEEVTRRAPKSFDELKRLMADTRRPA